MKHIITSRQGGILPLAGLRILIAASLVAFVRGGDLERFRDLAWVPAAGGGCVLEIRDYLEKWNVPVGGVGWRLRVASSTDNTIVPGLHVGSCVLPEYAPGYESVVKGMTAWNTLSLPACGASALSVNSGFRFANTPTIDSSSTPHAPDGNSLVAFVSTPAAWGLIGGPSTLAVTAVRGTKFPNTLLFVPNEADISVNASSSVFSFVEWNTATSKVFASALAPSKAFVDIQGTITHEAGHFLGLGHSLLDGLASEASSNFPTMFDQAQATQFQECVVQTTPSPCGLTSCAVVTGASTTTGGILAFSARSLELDDVAAIGRGYETAGFAAVTGGITGTVLDPGGVPVPGCHIAAYAKLCPGRIKASTLTDGDGEYRLTGLPPGEYYLSAERADVPYCSQNPNSLSCTPNPACAAADANHTSYFGGFLVPPNWIDAFAGCPPSPTCTPTQNWFHCSTNCCANCVWSNGIVSPGVFATDFWNTGEQAAELPQLATVVPVAAGTPLQVRDFVVAPSSPASSTPDAIVRPHLEVRGFGGGWSMRGGRVPRVVTSTQDRRLELRVTAGPAYHNRAVVVKIAYGLEFTGQPLFQVKETDHIGTPGGGPGVPGEVQLNGTLTVGTDGLARVTLVHQLGQDDDLRNIFAQATVSGPENEITNLVNLWLMSVN